MLSALLNHPMVTQEQWGMFTETDHKIWATLFERQSTLLEKFAAPEVFEGLQKLEICSTRIPKFSELNAILSKETNFSIVPVKGFIPEDLFFGFLAERKFPSTCFIRSLEQLDYIEEPDIFHDVFGHVPLLVNPIFADFMQEFGIKGLQAIEAGMLDFAATLYWFTVEFGLIKSAEGVRIYGAGILSSPNESIYSVQSPLPERLKFTPDTAMRTTYRTDSLQKTYFVIENFQQLFDMLKQLDWNTIDKN